MRWRDGVAAVAAAAMGLLVASARVEAEPQRREEPHYLLFATTDLWRHGGFTHGGIVWSPEGLDSDGFTLKLMLGGGTYRYISGALNNTEVSGQLLSATVLPGWRFVRGKLIVTIYGGLDFQDHKLTPDDRAAGLRGSYAGLRGNFELWYEPTPSTMIAADGMLSTIDTTYNARLAFGWKVFDRYYLGPEMQGFAAGENYRQFRAGIHVTGLRTSWAEWSASLGWASDSDDRDGVYGKLGVLLRR